MYDPGNHPEIGVVFDIDYRAAMRHIDCKVIDGNNYFIAMTSPRLDYSPRMLRLAGRSYVLWTMDIVAMILNMGAGVQNEQIADGIHRMIFDNNKTITVEAAGRQLLDHHNRLSVLFSTYIQVRKGRGAYKAIGSNEAPISWSRFDGRFDNNITVKRSNHPFVDLLVAANKVILVGVTNERLADALAAAYVRRGKIFWEQLIVISSGRQSQELLREGSDDKDEPGFRRNRWAQGIASLTRFLHSADRTIKYQAEVVGRRSVLLQYPGMLTLTGQHVDKEASGQNRHVKVIRFAPILPGVDSSSCPFLVVVEGSSQYELFSSSFDHLIRDSSPVAEYTLCAKNQDSIDLIIPDGLMVRHHGGANQESDRPWMFVAIVVLYDPKEKVIYLEYRTPFTAHDNILLFSNISGAILDEDYVKSIDELYPTMNAISSEYLRYINQKDQLVNSIGNEIINKAKKSINGEAANVKAFDLGAKCLEVTPDIVNDSRKEIEKIFIETAKTDGMNEIETKTKILNKSIRMAAIRELSEELGFEVDDENNDFDLVSPDREFTISRDGQRSYGDWHVYKDRKIFFSVSSCRVTRKKIDACMSDARPFIKLARCIVDKDKNEFRVEDEFLDNEHIYKVSYNRILEHYREDFAMFYQKLLRRDD